MLKRAAIQFTKQKHNDDMATVITSDGSFADGALGCENSGRGLQLETDLISQKNNTES